MNEIKCENLQRFREIGVSAPTSCKTENFFVHFTNTNVIPVAHCFMHYRHWRGQYYCTENIKQDHCIENTKNFKCKQILFFSYLI